MKPWRRVIEQFAHPRGRAGGLVARALNVADAPLNRAAVDALELPRGGRALDVGFGGGVALPRLMRRVGTDGVVAGVDPSPDMVARAAERFAEDARAGRLVIREAAAETLPFPDGHFDGVLSVNTVYYWPDLARGFTEIRRVLRPGGRVAIGVRPHAVLVLVGLQHAGHRAITQGELERALRDAGFKDVHVPASGPAVGGLVAVGRKSTTG